MDSTNTQKIEKSQRSKYEATKSAEVVTAIRAAGALDSDLRGPDYLAKHFLGSKYKFLYKLVRLAQPVFKWIFEVYIPGGFWYFQVRTKHIDVVLAQAIKDEIEQFVILGAGYDTRPYRFCEQLAGVSIFEVDLPGTQRRKKEQLNKLYGSLPEYVSYIPIDFNSQSIESVLIDNDYDPNKKTFFIWEGVSFYLPEDSVNNVLGFVKKHSPSGSSIVFDYTLRSLIDGDYRTYGAKILVEQWKKMGEPGVFGIEDGATDRFLSKRGFEVISDLGPKELERNYVTGQDGKQKGRIWGCMRIVNAFIQGV